MADEPVCANRGGVAQRGRALCSPCERQLAERKRERDRKRGR